MVHKSKNTPATSKLFCNHPTLQNAHYNIDRRIWNV